MTNVFRWTHYKVAKNKAIENLKASDKTKHGLRGGLLVSIIASSFLARPPFWGT